MFEQSVQKIMHRHGILSTYKKISSGIYNVESGKVENTETVHHVKIYMKHMKANQYNFPNLIGKSIGLFYISASDINFVPEVQDSIIHNNITYKVDSIQSHSAEGKIILYRIIGVI